MSSSFTSLKKPGVREGGEGTQEMLMNGKREGGRKKGREGGRDDQFKVPFLLPPRPAEVARIFFVQISSLCSKV